MKGLYCVTQTDNGRLKASVFGSGRSGINLRWEISCADLFRIHIRDISHSEPIDVIYDRTSYPWRGEFTSKAAGPKPISQYMWDYIKMRGHTRLVSVDDLFELPKCIGISFALD
jgi:hypothetical protein